MSNHYINIALIGSVSTGKSTLLNAILAGTYSDMKLIRTTMCPQVYCESDGELEACMDQIRLANRAVNLDMSQNGCAHDLPELFYQIRPIPGFYPLTDGLRYRIYDLPGINDQSDSAAFYQYLDGNLCKFDLIFFVFDIHTGFKQDEAELVDFLIWKIRSRLVSSQSCPHLLVLANKCDDMVLTNISSTSASSSNPTNELDIHQTLSGELLKNYLEIEQRLNQTINRHMLVSLRLFVRMIPFCAKQLYIYRTFRHSSLDQLDEKYLDLIATDQLGKTSWNKMLKQVSIPGRDLKEWRVEQITDILSSQNIDDCLANSGFGLVMDWFKRHITPKYQQWVALKKCQPEVH